MSDDTPIEPGESVTPAPGYETVGGPEGAAPRPAGPR